MRKILLIPGFYSGHPKFKKDVAKIYSFKGFDELITNNEATVLEWFNDDHYQNFNLINPLTPYNIYKKEKQLIYELSAIEDLENKLKNEQPSIIIAHSMGCLLFLNYLNNFTLPKSVKQIIFVQADHDRNLDINQRSLEFLKNNDIIFKNYYCPWDITLIFSGLINRYIPAGLIGSNSRYIQNKFYPLTFDFNIHLSSIKSRKFKDTILSKE